MVDEPLANVRIYITPDLRDTLTFSDGTYAFDYAYPGDYDVCIDMRSIPRDSKLASPDKLPINLKEDGKLAGINFFISSKPIEMEYFRGE